MRDVSFVVVLLLLESIMMLLVGLFPKFADKAVFLFATGGDPMPIPLEVNPNCSYPALTA